MPGDNLAQFKQILANLPEDRRKRLYDRLHAMPASQREAETQEHLVLKLHSSETELHRALGEPCNPSKAEQGCGEAEEAQGPFSASTRVPLFLFSRSESTQRRTAWLKTA